MDDPTEQFLNKLDTFATGLEPTEQAMLAYLVRDTVDDDVAGFSFEAWPAKVIDIAPLRVAGLVTTFHGPPGTGKTVIGSVDSIVKSGGGNSI